MLTKLLTDWNSLATTQPIKMPDYVEFDDPYASDQEYEVEELRVRLGNLLLMTAVVLVGLLLLVILWKICFSDEHEPPSKQPVGTPQAVYAHEIEPGFVVLQSQDGQFFRILHEYSEAKWNRSTGRSPAVGNESRGNLTRSDSSSSWRPGPDTDTTVYTPHYTSAHYQTQPTAPLPAHVGPPASPLLQQSAMSDRELMYFDGEHSQPPPYNARE